MSDGKAVDGSTGRKQSQAEEATEGDERQERSKYDFSWLQKETLTAVPAPGVPPPVPEAPVETSEEWATELVEEEQEPAARKASESQREQEARQERAAREAERTQREWDEPAGDKAKSVERAEAPAPMLESPAEAEVAQGDETVEDKTDIDYLARAKEASLRQRESQEEVKRDFDRIVREVEGHISSGYDLIGLVGFPSSGKTHFLRALSLLLKTQHFEVADWRELRKSRVPGFTAAEAFYYPASRKDEKWVFVDAGGELYARLSINDWQLAENSAGLLHSLHHCRALFLLLHLQPGHFRIGSAGEHRWMDEQERERDAAIQAAQEELEFFDSFLLFLRAVIAESGRVKPLVERCADQGLDKALRRYRDQAPRLDIPVQVLFTQADKFADSNFEVAEAVPLSPRNSTVGVTPFVARHLPTLLGTMLEHARQFRFDFVQSYEEKRFLDADGIMQSIPQWSVDEELLSCGALPALEFLIRNLPAKGFLERQLQRRELDTRNVLRLDRWLRRRLWRGVETPL